jgi:hypothetical protein
MGKHWLAILLIGAWLGSVTPTLIADNGKGQGKGNPHANKNKAEDEDQGWQQRDGYEYRVYDQPNGQPPGWSHGKKTGWGNCGLPPGQAKKYGCRTYVHQGRPYYYYEDDHGRTVVRRPIIEVHGSVTVAP